MGLEINVASLGHHETRIVPIWQQMALRRTPEKSCSRGRLRTGDLLVQTCLEQLLFELRILFTFVTKQANLNEEVNCTDPFPSVSIPCTHTLLPAPVMQHLILQRSSMTKP